MAQKRALAVHDISCVGRCSLTVALPILSAAGIETAVLPTALLSTHTGGFTGFTYRDLSADINSISDHWYAMGLSFDSIYTGYLASVGQIELVAALMERFGANALKLVDPVMADNGALYTGFSDDYPIAMRRLCGMADIIIPNMTEAFLLLGEEYTPGPYEKAHFEGLIRRLSAVNRSIVVVTGVYFNSVDLGAAVYDPETDEVSYCFDKRIPGTLHGTGDVFSSAFLGALLNGSSLIEAVGTAVCYTRSTIETTFAVGKDTRMGPCFEITIPEYIAMLGLDRRGNIVGC
ncbi:MAG: pyridoxamine kinase [Clostridiales bacterium]|nr:pyridoxamine kinase [Clostridiales bacterium]